MQQLRKQFAFITEDERILGIILYGSHVTGDATPRSDVDICIVTRDKDLHTLYQMLTHIWGNVPVAQLKYDVRMFHELPLFIQGRVIESGEVILTRDAPELFEYLYPSRKLWEEQKSRHKLSPEEVDALFS